MELQPGTILYLHCDFIRPAKEKFLALLCKEPMPLFFFINSGIRPFIQRRESLRRCQVRIGADDHPCLDYDSWVDCTEACTVSDYLRQIERNEARIKDRVSADVLGAIIEATKQSPLIPELQKEWILAGSSKAN